MEEENNLAEYSNKCTLVYKVNTYQKKVKIFDSKFCKTNSKNCEILINGQKQEICDYYQNINFEENITIELTIGISATDLSNMFSGCSSLSSINIISNWNTKNITNMKWMFFGCTSLESLPDISNWDISNVADIQFMFAGCKSLKSLPDISKWNTKNITNMSGLFSECSTLKSLPDISKWDTLNVNNINKIFSSCINLASLPDISKWNTSKIENMSSIFNECLFLLTLPDISKWNTFNVKNMSYMFSKCKSLNQLPDISKWETQNVMDISFMFSECFSLASLPDLSKWNTTNILFMNGLFMKCHLLESLPDLSKWNTKNVTNMSHMFSECSSLKRLPNLSKWNITNVTEMVRMFSDCASLKSFPDISIWDFSGVNDKSYMFSGCKFDFLKEKIFTNDYNEDEEKYPVLTIQHDKNNIIRNDDLKFFPLIEIKFNNINIITQVMIDNIKSEISYLIEDNNFSIIEVKKGSLIIVLSLQFIIFNEIKKQKELNLDFDLNRFANQFSDNVKEEVRKISSVLKNHEFISMGTVKPDYVDEDIIDFKNENNRNELVNKIKSIPNNKEENNINIYEIGKIEELEIFYTRILQDAAQQEKNQSKLIKDLAEFNNLFDTEIEEALKRTYFEFKIIHICLVDKEKGPYLSEKDKCQNRVVKILYHGTKTEAAISILSDKFYQSTHHVIGPGVYFTDLLDYAWNYTRTRYGIPRVGESFSFVASEVYYDNSKYEFVYDTRTFNDPVQKNGVRCCYGYFNGHKVHRQELEQNKKPIGQEYLITDNSQILPLYTVSVKRLEYIIIWRDYNFNSENPNKYSKEVFDEMQEFHRKIKKFISRELDSKIYYAKTTEEALDLIERKKYNKIFIITNGNNDAKNFINEARKIIGSNVIAAVSIYNIPLHISWIKTMKNTLLLNDQEFHYKYLKAIMKKVYKALKMMRKIIN